MDVITIVALFIVLLIIVIIVGLAFIFLDLISYTSTGAESMSPSGNVNEKALVVFAPGISGMAKNAANDIANQLNSKGYDVKLAGVKSAAATNTSGYDIIIAGGPMYFGKVSKSIDTYLKTLNLQKEVKLGVFATTGTDQFNSDDFQMFTKQVEMLTVDTTLNKKVTIKLIRSGNESLKDDADLVSETIQ
jgi:flavodoxin